MAKLAARMFSKKMKTMVEATETPWQYDKTTMERSDHLLTTELWSDCSFLVGSEKQEVFGHKLILAMTSPVFEVMFYGPLSGKDHEKLIPDIEPDVFRTMLKYIYTGKTDIFCSFNLAWKLWLAADEYDLPHLVDKCKEYIRSIVDPTNACQIYEIARLFKDQSLMDRCIQEIRTNTKKVLNDKSFEEVELNTVITVCSLDPLNVDNELDLFHAVARYAKAQEKTQEHEEQEQSIRRLVDVGVQVNCSEDETTVDSSLVTLSMTKESPTTEDKVVNGVILSSAQNTPAAAAAVELEPKSDDDTEEQSEPLKKKNKKNIQEVPGKPNIRTAIQKIRFLSLTPQQFADGLEDSALLSETESLDILINITSKVGKRPMPTGFSNCRVRRQQVKSPTASKQQTAVAAPTASKQQTAVAAPTALPSLFTPVTLQSSFGLGLFGNNRPNL